ncbi:MAG: DUF4038 domain-containing protein [Anaerolineae bacterium]
MDKEVAQWTVTEAVFASDRDYENPFWDVDLQVRFQAPSGVSKLVDAFWDGGRTWRVRFSPDEVGPWSWVTLCSDKENAGLDEQAGEFLCVPYGGDNAVYRHGRVRVSDDQRYLTWADGEPYFWLGDTAWNGVLRAQEEDWHQYLAARRDQAFTAIQFVSTQWRGAKEVLGGERAFEGSEQIHIHPDFFRKRDEKVAAINAHGLIAAPVILWALWETDPGQALPEADAIRLARYIVARWGAYQVIWFLGGDGNYLGERAERWRRIGPAVFEEDRDRLVTMHPCGQTWVGQEFRGEPWFDFIGYQSGHGSSEEHLRWLVEGPPSKNWCNEPPLPVINLEPNYEGHPSYHADHRFGAQEVRRAAYWSLLVSPTAGVTYGTNPIWVWPDEPEVPDGHERIGTVAPWHEALDTPGIRSMTTLRRFFESLPWWTLRPAPELLAEQPGEDDPRHFIAAAKTEDGGTAVIYTPVGGTVKLNVDALPEPPVICWFDPRAGDWTDVCALPDTSGTLQTPDEDDWVLCVKHGDADA